MRSEGRRKLAGNVAARQDRKPMSQMMEIEMPDEVLLGLQKEPKQLAAEMRVAAAVKWYEMGR